MESAVVVHQSSLLDALATLFEAFWDRALPLSFSAEVVKDLGTEAGDEEIQAVLALLIAELTYEVMTRQLVCSISDRHRTRSCLEDHLCGTIRFLGCLR